ncbi:hypothetical protein MGWOODY_Mmi1598 [hydrothermal vent metagenome]|uniref:Uncharacterized protein n=1 Tax=hydrothermal vent metagenome TaxID=652676 RepID=A0A160VHE0_9ZZZZ
MAGTGGIIGPFSESRMRLLSLLCIEIKFGMLAPPKPAIIAGKIVFLIKMRRFIMHSLIVY